MYLPAHFDERRPEVLQGLVRTHPLGLLVTQGETGLQANSIPFFLDAGPGPHGTLRAHVARANPVWREAAGSEALVVFQGPQAYISPGWYPSKAEHGKVVPTWNYAMVQARGTLRAIDDAEWLREFVTRLTTTHEATQSRPWAVSDAPPAFVDTMLRAIVGIEIELTALVGKWKVSQNRSAADRAGTAAGLDATPGDEAAAMAREVRAPGGA
jgi:transcriptional regulator